MRVKMLTVALACLAIVGVHAGPTSAHGLAGKRFFPATLVIDDPFVADELSLPSVFHIKTPASGDEAATRETSLSGEFSKRITPNLGLSVEGEWTHLDPDGERSRSGFGNLELGLKYQFFKSDLHETIFSLGLGWEVGGTGKKSVEADSFSTLSPALFFGKGFGDLPDALAFLKPLTLTGVIGADIPTRSKTKTVRIREEEGEDAAEVETEIERHPNVLTWGFALEYSIPYLQSFVKDVGLPAPFNRMFPLVEFALETPLDRGMAGKTTGTVNPGIIWAGKVVQIGLEAVIPINDRTGKNVGVRGMLHFFLDDLFPKSLGRPIFGR
jgi:hypothetical protein